MGDIFRAAREGNEGEVIRLLDADPELLERENEHRDRPLAAATSWRQLRVVRLLIERGANINATGTLLGTVLHYAAVDGYDEVAALLLDKGASANSRDRKGMTPLMWACFNGHLGVVKMLVQHMHGQGLQERSDRGWTALHNAAYRGHEDIVRCLLLGGADLTITDNEGRTPRAHAEETPCSERRRREGRARCVAVLQVRPKTC
jgi:ankyrin repeat protein